MCLFSLHESVMSVRLTGSVEFLLKRREHGADLLHGSMIHVWSTRQDISYTRTHTHTVTVMQRSLSLYSTCWKIPRNFRTDSFTTFIFILTVQKHKQNKCVCVCEWVIKTETRLPQSSSLTSTTEDRSSVTHFSLESTYKHNWLCVQRVCVCLHV